MKTAEQLRRDDTLFAHWKTWPRWQRRFLLAVGLLSATILLKFAAVQYMEYLYLTTMAVLLLVFVQRNYEVIWFRPFLRIWMAWIGFGVAALALSFAALRFTFYPPAELTLLRRPVWITVARLVELSGNVSMMVYMAHLIRQDGSKGRFLLRVYFWTGVASVVYSLISLPSALKGNFAYGVYTETYRFRGFYNEGGPYGNYLVTVGFVGLALWQMQWERRSRLLWTAPLLAIGIIFAQSKAAAVSVLLVLLLNGILAGSVRRGVLIVAATAVLVTVLARSEQFQVAWLLYQRESRAYERLSHHHLGDENYIDGRVAGAFIVPRMVEAHPWTGLGWGNYGNLRNAPEYRGAAAWSLVADDPGLGLLGSAADYGLPLLTYLLFCFLLPYFYLRRQAVPSNIKNLALMQPVSHLCGAQLNLTYPWVVTACALGMTYWVAEQQKLQALEAVETVV